MPEYSDGLVLAWQVAAAEAGAAAHATIKREHFFVALCRLIQLSPDELSSAPDKTQICRQLSAIVAELEELRRVFSQAEVDGRELRRRLVVLLGREGSQPTGGVMHRSAEARRLFARAEELCAKGGGGPVRPVHLLQALCETEDAGWSAALQEMGISQAGLLAAAELAGRAQATLPVSAAGAVAPAPARRKREASASQSRTPKLDSYGRDLTRLAAEGKLPPVINRHEEIRRLGQVLLQQRRNNAILVGEAGVGKTCIVEGLAHQMARPDAAEHFRSKRIVELSLGALVAGTRYRGEFEDRLRGLLSEASSDPNVILFIDEIHTVIGAGAAGAGSMDAAEMLKPALARGEISCIGATTIRDYRQHIEKDPALQRRFQVIWVDEPTREEAIAILKGLLPTLQQHHNLSIRESAVVAAVEMTMRHAADQRLPDKAVDVIDEACARARLRTFSGLSVASAVERDDIAQVISDRYRVPLDRLTEDESRRLLQMEKALVRRVKGQPAAVAAVAEVVRAARAGLAPPNRPKGVFLFLGPTGTGKTELAKALAEFLFGTEERIIRFDMSEYGEAHTVSKLIGAPPGYVGYEEEGQLTSTIRTHPYSVLLLDEIEKAHPRVHELLLQVLDEGWLTDAHGRRAYFTEAVIILTSNLGSTHGVGEHGLGLRPSADLLGDEGRRRQFHERMLAAARAALAPELLNRIQRVVLFNPLGREAAREIIDSVLERLRGRLNARSLTLELDESAYELLMQEGFSEAYGAREMERTVARLITEPLSSLLIAGGLSDGTTLRARTVEGRIVFQ